jgi:hypothetical protein
MQVDVCVNTRRAETLAQRINSSLMVFGIVAITNENVRRTFGLGHPAASITDYW